jgi:hypothetical protein
MNDHVNAPCADCGIETLDDDNWYMLHNHVWESAWPGSRTTRAVLEAGDDGIAPFSEFLCIDCLEKRLGRGLTPHDFSDAPINATVLSRLFK